MADALQQLQLGTLCSKAAGKVTSPARGAPADVGGLDPADVGALAGSSDNVLGVCAADLLEEALPPEADRRRALFAVLPALEAALRQRCADVAGASGYGSSSDFSGLPDHLAQLQQAVLQQRSQQVGAARL